MCCFSPDGTKRAVASAEGIKLLEVPTEQHIYTRQHVDAGELEFSVDVFSVAFSPDGTKLASALWDGVKLCEVSTGRNLTTLRGHARVVTAVTFSPDRLTLASNSMSGVQMWGGCHRTTYHHTRRTSELCHLLCVFTRWHKARHGFSRCKECPACGKIVGCTDSTESRHTARAYRLSDHCCVLTRRHAARLRFKE